MKLRAYLDSLPHGGVSGFAKQLGISSVYLHQLAAGQDGREPSPALCWLIKEASGGKVQLWDLRPNDWNQIWPMLVGTKGAPKVPGSKKPRIHPKRGA